MAAKTDSTFPPNVADRSAWYGPQIVTRTDWIERLSEAEVDEIRRAAGELEKSLRKSATVELASLRAKHFPLPTLGPRLRGMLDEVLNGRGFVLIKGLPVESWTRREAAIAFLVIGVQLGALRMQNAAGHLLGHVRDLGRSSDDPNTRIY